MVNMSLHYGKYVLTTWLCSYLQITRYYALHFHIFIILNVVIIIMTILMSTVQKNQQRMFLVVVAISSLFLAGSMINLITGQISQQQYVFAQKKILLLYLQLTIRRSLI